MLARSQITTVLVVGMLMLSMVAIATPVAGDDANGATVQTLENGEDLYLVFGVDIGDQTLEEFLDDHLTDNPGHPAEGQDAVSEVIQYQDVEQVNLNEEGAAVSISIDGGNATAIQEVSQQNNNAQVGEAVAENQAFDSQSTQFENVGTVHIVMGNGDGQQFSGWGVADSKTGEPTVTQSAEAAVSQYQDVTQVNYAEQTTAFAFAENESEAVAFQQISQANQNLQEGAANATNVYEAPATAAPTNEHYKKDPGISPKYDYNGDDGDGVSQDAAASVEQGQDVEQANVNEAGAAVAIAVGDGSSATAVQLTEQTNINEQLASADAVNVLAAMPGMNVATADMDDNDVVSTQTERVDGDDHDKKGDKKGDDGVSQAADASVAQYQEADQFNINVQSSAVAVATNESTATAIQLMYQTNYNAQVGAADAWNVYQGGATHGGLVYTEETTVTLGGDELTDNSMIAFDYDGTDSQLNDVEQHSSATIEQAQFVGQQNFVEQSAAIAVADDGGDATSSQIIMQENRNVQYTAVGSGGVFAAP
ncbi:hypothetical protein [Natrononativus amylolyticus]|uniref:hypothetical protein n=1 Tax=Natrononativus amylolyticus TaxID=2963434 RepID=UPI0020CCB1B3|nr:hypothetical protein [Natrononativus amylolyticus]